MGDDAGEHQEEQQQKDAEAGGAAVGRPLGIAQMELVEGPLGQQNNAGRNQQHRPPMAVPLPESAEIQTAGLNQQEEHADGDQQQGAENGAAAHSPHLVADLLPLRSDRVTLRAHLGAKLIALVSPLRLWIVAGRRRRRRWWRIARHDLPSFPVVVQAVAGVAACGTVSRFAGHGFAAGNRRL